MKKSILMILSLMMAGILLTGCGKSNNYAVSVELAEQWEETERTDENGELLLSLTGNYPVVSVKGNEEAEKKINDYIAGLVKEAEEQADTDEEYAREDKAMWTEDMGEFLGYGFGNEYVTGRADSQVISFRQDGYEFTGGAHPNGYAFGYNFSTETGELLTLKDVVSDEAAAKTFIEQTILTKTKEPEYKDMFFEGYEEFIPDVFSDSTWYFSEDGFVVICNEYILGPHASGIIEFTIPYDQFTLLNEEYVLRQASK